MNVKKIKTMLMDKLFYIYIMVLLVLFGCKKEDEVQDNSNDYIINTLNCEIIIPDNGIEVPQGTLLTILVEVSDSVYQLREVVFYMNHQELAIVENEPYRYNWNTTSVDTGSFIIKTIAKNSIGLTKTNQVTVKIVESDFGIQGSGVEDIDGNHYKTVIIGQQEWMAENLKVTHYANGNAIPHVTGDNNWKEIVFNEDAYSWYNDDVFYKDIYGALYTRVAAMGSSTSSSNLNPSGVQGVCPNGWHLPSDSEWIELFNELGGYEIARGKLKEIGTIHWNNPNVDATNESGFRALPGGYRSSIYGNCMSMGNTGYWWSSTENIYHYLTNNNNTDIHLTGSNAYGFSVRCVKNE